MRHVIVAAYWYGDLAEARTADEEQQLLHALVRHLLTALEKGEP